MKLFILVIGMVLILEGLPYASAPEKMKEWLLKLAEVPASQLRVLGFIAMLIGFLLCWVAQKS
ncbi:MAG: DUF2065 domain-containing protein [Desulfobulbaceae bacterium]|nr:MAG: DUF2065 domain-containing protein [Desulfobulbaceae bacterium]